MIHHTLRFFLLFSVSTVLNAGFEGGVPALIMKSDYASLNLTFIKFKQPIPKGKCDSGEGVVLRDNNKSAKVGVSLAITAFASGDVFKCYVGNQCQRTTGAVTTYPVCDEYPLIYKP